MEKVTDILNVVTDESMLCELGRLHINKDYVEC